MKLFVQSVLLAILLTSGCSTVPNPYKPVQVGYMDYNNVADGIEFTIKPAADSLVMGDILSFDVWLKNVGPSGFWFPREPEIMLTWIYSSGQRDNLMFEQTEEKFFAPSEAVFVKPGQTMKTRMKIKTYYFPRIGITEFQAFYEAPRNTNPDLTPFWDGRILSNSYGVKVFSSRQAMVRQTASNVLTTIE